MSPDEQEELASLYALGLLEGDQREIFEEEMRLHPGLRRIVTEFERGATQLATSLPRVSVPPMLKQSIMSRLESSQESVETPAPAQSATHTVLFWIPWAAAATIAIFCAILWKQKVDLRALLQTKISENSALLVTMQRLKTDYAALQTRADKLEAEKKDQGLRLAALETHDPLKDVRPVILAPQQGAPVDQKLVALWDSAQSVGCINLDALPEPAAGRTYQMWIIAPGSPQPISAGILSQWRGKHVMFNSPQPLAQIAALAISVEPAGGSVSPQGPVVYVGKF